MSATAVATRPASKQAPKQALDPTPELVKEVERTALAVSVRELRALIESGDEWSLLNVDFTPELARVSLEYNKPGETNRAMSPSDTQRTAKLIKDGLWLNTGEPLIFARGVLNDGQGRCSAVALANRSIVLDIRFGVSRDAFIATNSGRKRTGGDALHIAGYKNWTQIAAAARMALAYRDGLPSSLFTLAPSRLIVDTVEAWPELVDAVSLCGSLERQLRRSSSAAVAFFALRTKNRHEIEAFIEILKTGGGSPGSGPHRWREHMLRNKDLNSSNERIRSLALGIIAWNHWRKGKEISRLRWANGDPFPEVDGLTL